MEIALLCLLAQADAGLTAWTLADDVESAFAQGKETEWTLGGRAGYIKTRDAERGTWFGGVQSRIYFGEYFAVEGSITFHQDEFDDGLGGDVDVTQYPVEVSAMVFPFQDLKNFRPYTVGGLGWYYTRIEFENPLFDDDTDNVFGLHFGVGCEVPFSPKFTAHVDIRYIFLDEPDSVDDEEFDAWQVTIGGSFKFS